MRRHLEFPRRDQNVPEDGQGVERTLARGSGHRSEGTRCLAVGALGAEAVLARGRIGDGRRRQGEYHHPGDPEGPLQRSPARHGAGARQGHAHSIERRLARAHRCGVSRPRDDERPPEIPGRKRLHADRQGPMRSFDRPPDGGRPGDPLGRASRSAPRPDPPERRRVRPVPPDHFPRFLPGHLHRVASPYRPPSHSSPRSPSPWPVSCRSRWA